MSIELSLAVQYGTAVPELPRWRIRRWVRHAADALEAQSPNAFSRLVLTLRLADADEARRLNREFRQGDYATNVLTFEYGIDPAGILSADIVLCVPVLEHEAREQRKSLLAHAAHLTVHGVLHAAGYDHIELTEAQQMEDLEIRILERMGIENPYQAP